MRHGPISSDLASLVHNNDNLVLILGQSPSKLPQAGRLARVWPADEQQRLQTHQKFRAQISVAVSDYCFRAGDHERIERRIRIQVVQS
jgi:hypothetical protein